MVTLLRSLWKDESGQATVEYALVIGLIALAVTTVLITFRQHLETLWGTLTSSLDAQGAKIPTK